MTHARIKILIAAIALIGSVTYLSVAGVKKGWVYYLKVDQFLEQDTYQGQRVRLHGKVGAESLIIDRVNFLTDFQLVGIEGQVHVIYEGSIPDMFEAGREVVVEGKLDEAGIFRADQLMTKCASKYKAEEETQNNTDTGTDLDQLETGQ